jgi:hypothetical protein
MAEVRRRRREYWAGLAAVVAAATIVAAGLWPVPDSLDAERSVVEAMLDDVVLVGLLRLAIVAAVFYFIASVPALVIGGRWAKGLGTTGIVADDAAVSGEAIARAKEQVAALEALNERLERERSELWRLVDVETAPD